MATTKPKPKYRRKWKPNHTNKEFWKEVLIGRKIVKSRHKDGALQSLTLDSGEVLYLDGWNVKTEKGQKSPVPLYLKRKKKEDW